MADGVLARLVDRKAEEILAHMAIESPTLRDLEMAKALALSRITGSMTYYTVAFKKLLREIKP